jgi:hypothetical protein
MVRVEAFRPSNLWQLFCSAFFNLLGQKWMKDGYFRIGSARFIKRTEFTESGPFDCTASETRRESSVFDLSLLVLPAGNAHAGRLALAVASWVVPLRPVSPIDIDLSFRVPLDGALFPLSLRLSSHLIALFP